MYGPNIPTTCTAADVMGSAGNLGVAEVPRLSVVVPVFDNAASLPELHERLVETLAPGGAGFEIIYVNDGSRDHSLKVLNELPASAGVVTVADLEKNSGQSAAVMAGFSIARGAILVTIDADLENEPRDIPMLVKAVEEGADLACGVRGTRMAPLITRRGPSWLANQLVGHALRVSLRDWGCGLNAVTSEIVRRMLDSEPMPRLPKIAAALLARRVAEVPVAYSARRHGKSGYTIGRLAGFASAFLHDFGIRRTFKRIVASPSTKRVGPGDDATYGGWVATAFSVVVSVMCWSILAVLALLVRASSILLGRRPPPTTFRIRAVNTRPSVSPGP